MSEKLTYVIFNKDTGEITGIRNSVDESDTYIQVPLKDVLSLKRGQESKKNYIVQYNPKSKTLELQSKYDQSFDAASVNDIIYEIPTDNVDDADVQIVQDIPNTCWKIKVGNTLKKNIKSKGINLNASMMFSITEKGDPNILYKTLSVHVGQALNDNYYVVPFSMPFEETNTPLSIYTVRRFDTYNLTRIFNEQD
jgi:hypothetical protein